MNKQKCIVVGGGAVGLAVAEALVQSGIQVELLEQGISVGQESSWAAAGMLSPEPEATAADARLDLLLRGISLYPQVVHRLEAATGVHLRFRASGLLALPDSDQEVEFFFVHFKWIFPTTALA